MKKEQMLLELAVEPSQDHLSRMYDRHRRAFLFAEIRRMCIDAYATESFFEACEHYSTDKLQSVYNLMLVSTP